ncbi:hypothetical protein [Paenibacillus glycinis]|uniref:Uncharacterized protein n=1 Tax=Paenibacillus glycinis TaxID=2697035 RepID=A0ABW9XRL7_9BACL|nr:hypothetical protein [Paenibacillus glycinis]NBD25031.1 hypothetical protein [Paenibacillus glycinis]
MPIYNPNNMQGAHRTDVIILSEGDAPAVLMEWGHYFDTVPSLLSIQGGAIVNNISEHTISVALRIMFNNIVLDSYVVRLTSATYTSAFFGTSLFNVIEGHHVFRILAQITEGVTGDTATITNRQVISISGVGTL